MPCSDQHNRHEPLNLYLKGDRPSSDEDIVIPIDLWPKFKEAIEAYNEKYKE